MYPDHPIFGASDENRFGMFDKVCGSKQIRDLFSKRFRWDDVRGYWYKDVASFKRLSKKYYLYQ
jgi:uncharacterized protein YbbC (DUF1343 family)